ncbi:MAG TPA: hypothetical protein ENJ33_08375 [Thiothrix sp.]|nr:hypothetical protein [Thiothrix sp.]
MKEHFFKHWVYYFVVLFFVPSIASCAGNGIPEASPLPAAIIPETVFEPITLPSLPVPVQPLPSYTSEPASPASPVFSSTAASSSTALPQLPIYPIVIIPRSSWMSKQSRINLHALVPHSATIQRITIHHTATPQRKNIPASLRGIQRYHQQEKGWADIAYHYLIAADGKIYEGRNAAYIGSSSTTYPLDNNLMIALVGNFEKYPPSEQALSALKNLVLNRLAHYHLKPTAVYTHGEQADTLCPGRYLKNWYVNQGKTAISRLFYVPLAKS